MEVQRADLRMLRFVDDPLPALREGQALLQVESFGLSSNNVTYAATGERLGYWQFFPAQEEGWGRVPVWGFAHVGDSRVGGLEVGTRLFGYLPLATHVVVEPGRLSRRGFVDVTAHRKSLPSPYNAYRFVDTDELHVAGAEDVQAVFFPLFATSFMLDDFLADNDDFGAEQIVVSSASSKTSVGVALCIGRRSAGRPQVVGLTSTTNAPFVRGLRCYDEVATYDAIETLPTRPTVYVDVAGDGQLLGRVHRRFGDQLRHSSAVGLAHWEAPAADSGLPGPRPAFFFAPNQIDKRMADWGPAGYQRRLAEAWRDMVAGVRERFDFPQINGMEGVPAVYLSLADGSASPADAFEVRL